MELKTRVPYKLSQLVRETLVPTVMPLLDNASSDLRNRLKDVTKQLDKDAINAGIYDEITIPSIDLTLRDTLDALRFAKLVNPEVIYEEVPSRFAQFFSFFSGKNAQTANDMAYKIAVDSFNEKMESIRQYLQNDFTQIFEQSFNEVVNQYETYANNRQKELKKAKEDHDSLTQNLSTLEAEAKTLAARETTLQEGLRELDYLLEGGK